MRPDVTFWGAVVCSQVYVAAPGINTGDMIMSLLWLVFAIGVWALDIRRTRST